MYLIRMIKMGGIALTKIQPKKLNKKPVNWEMKTCDRKSEKTLSVF